MKRHNFFALIALLIAAFPVSRAQAQETTNPVLVTIAESSARPGDRVLVPVEINGMEGREIVSGEVKVKFDPAVLAGGEIVRHGTLIGDQRWLTADQIDSSPVDFHVFQAVFAAATGFTRDGDLVFLEFVVNSTAAIGTETTLEVIDASFNNGEPLASLGSGTFRVVSQVVRADFVARPRRGPVPLEVQFSENSFGDIESYLWNFGDGGSSQERNPVHVYSEEGNYTVSLTVSGEEGSATEEKEDFIEALPDITPPEIINGPKAVDIKQESADILWITNERSDSFVEYSTREDFPESMTVLDETLERQHRIELSGLEPNTRYFYRVRSTDAAGNPSDFRRGFFHTRKQPDNRPPVITRGPGVEEVTDQSAVVVWRTNEVSTSIVEYVSEDFSNPMRVEDDELVEEHRVVLEELEASTRYFYQVRSVDSSGNASDFKEGTFRTRAAPDGRPPVILLGPVAIGRTHHSVTIKWITNESASSQVDYGTGTDYGATEIKEGRRFVHLVRLTNLEPSTLYHAQVTSTDRTGNTVVSEDFEFITRGVPDHRFPKIVLRPFAIGRFLDRLVVRWETDEPCAGVVEYGRDHKYGSSAHTQEHGRVHTVVLSDLEEDEEYHFRVSVTDLSGNGPVFSKDRKGRTLAAVLPLRILQGPIVANRGDDRVTIRWKTSRPADSYVDFGPDGSYGEQAGSADLSLDHEVVVSGLEAGARYHYQVASTDPCEESVTSGDVTFTTRATGDTQEPLITRGPEVVGLTDNSASIYWHTSETTDALVEFGTDLNYGETIFQEEFKSKHRIRLTGLEPDRTYHFRVASRDRAGNGPVTSADISFSTLSRRDLQPPAIIAGPGIGDSQTGQVTVVWRTDEPADSFVDFGESAAYGQQAGSSDLTRTHEVTLTDLSPGTKYHYRVSSTDPAGNTSTTDPAGHARWSRDLTFRTREGADDKPPVIVRGPLIIASNRGALISFDTNELSIARLAYGTARTLGTPDEEVVYETEASIEHRIRIGHLKRKTRYLFHLTCQDAAGNVLTVGAPKKRRAKAVPVAEASDFSGALEFFTEEDDDTASPVIVEGPTLISRTADTAIIEWKTDEPADGYVDYGIGEPTQTVGDAEYVQEHSVFLTGLEPGSTYAYRVRSTDFAANAPLTSELLSFTTSLEADLTPPALLTEPQLVFADAGQAIIEWKTDESTSVQLTYGTEGGEELVFFDETFTSEHSTQLTGLAAGTTYTYRISLTDASGNSSVSSDLLSFTTAEVADIAPPQINAVAVGEIADASAIVTWTTDEPASSFVYYGAGDSLELASGDAELTRTHRVMLTNLSPGTAYSFQIESIDPAGNGSGTSAPTSFATGAQPDTEPPSGLADFEARVGLETAILSWSASPAADLSSYTIYRQIRSNPFEPLVTGLADTYYVDEGLSFGTAYTYYVTAVDLAGNESEPSSEAGDTPSIRNVPSSISPLDAQLSDDRVTLTVSNAQPGRSSGILTYTFHVSTSELFDDIVARGAGIAQGSETTSWSFDKELEPGLEYWWRARADDEVFDGPWSFPSFFAASQVAANPGDFNADGVVNFDDFFLFADAFGSGEEETSFNANMDMSANGRVDFDDFFIFADLFGTVYSSSRLLVDSGVETELEFSAISHLHSGDLRVDLIASNADGWRGIGLIVGYDPTILEWLEEEPGETDFLRGLDGERRFYTWVPLTAGEVALLTHRMEALPFAGEGSVAQLRFRPLAQIPEATIELRSGAVQTTAGISRLTEPKRLRVRLVPQRFALAQNFPNPFNPETTISYDLPVEASVRLEVFDLLGQQVRSLAAGEQAAGRYQLRWDGRDSGGREMGSGVYFYRLRAGDFTAVGKMLLVR